MKLNRTGSNWNRLERNKINENWDIIEGSYNDVVGQITDEVVGHLLDSAKLIWKEPVDTVEDLPANAEVGETRMVREADPDGISYVYRYDGEKWEKIQAIDVTLVNEVDRRLTRQLAENVSYTDSGLGLLHRRKHGKKTIVSFIADDGTITDYTKLKGVVEDKEVPLGLAIVTNWMDNPGYMSTEQIKEMESLGCEIMSHSHTHRNFATLSKSEQIDEFRISKEILRAKGFNPRGFVYPFNSTDNNSRESLPGFYESGFAKFIYGNSDMPGINTPRFRNREIGRNALGSYFDDPTEGFRQDRKSLEYYKSLVAHAEIIENWLVFVLHSEPMDSNQVQHFSDIIDYIRGKGIDIVSPSEGLEIYGNIIEIEGKSENFLIDANGVITSNRFKVIFDKLNGRDINIPASSFPNERVIYTPVTNNFASNNGLPERLGGVVKTSRITSEYYHAKQEYEPTLGTKRKYVRYANSNYTWGDWEREQRNIVETGLNKYTAESLPNEFIPNVITTFYVNNNGATGFPNNAAGIITVYTIGDQYGYYKQEYRPYQGNGLWSRTGKNDNTWGSWDQLL